MEKSNLTRPIHPIPEFVLLALEEHNVMDDFHARPDYQRNDYIGWINRAKREDTKLKRMNQMLDELKRGGVYMKMDHPASRKN